LRTQQRTHDGFHIAVAFSGFCLAEFDPRIGPKADGFFRANLIVFTRNIGYSSINGLWSDNSVAMFGALYRMHFPLNAEGQPAPSRPVRVPKAPDTLKLNQDKLH
jgi:hypothetical protein